MRGSIAATVGLLLILAGVARSEDINPYPRPVLVGEVLKEWTFDAGPEGWGALHECTLAARAGTLHIENTGHDPYLSVPCSLPAGSGGLVVRARMKCKATGGGEFFWITQASPAWSARKQQGFALAHDGKWHEYQVLLGVSGRLKGLRLDPGGDKGKVEVDWIRVHAGGLHPLEISRLEVRDDEIRAHVRNHGRQEVAFSVGGRRHTAGAGKTTVVSHTAAGTAPFEAYTVEVKPDNLPAVRRTTVLYRPAAKEDWIKLESRFAAVQWTGSDRGLSAMIAREETLSVYLARDGAGGALFLNGKLVAYLAPLVLARAAPGAGAPRIAKLKLTESTDKAARFAAPGLKVRVAVDKAEIDFQIESDRPVEGPVVRALGSLEQGLFAGLEYLGKGEGSSSKLDIETPDHLRFAPDPLKVTMPLMTFLTDRTAIAMTWKDMSLQPRYATPNFFDGTADHRMSLGGRKIQATLLVRQAALEGTVLWAVGEMGGLPPLPKPPRTKAQQWALAVKSINGPISGEGGWGHCAEPRWGRQRFADIASTLWRITGQAPKLERIAPGGAHVPNDAIFFATGQVSRWLEIRRNQARSIAAAQKPDGSFRYRGKAAYRRGHFEDTATGACAQPARTLLQFAHITGDRAALDAGLKALKYMKRFRTPRGAQTWELSLHTPDILASANLVWSYVRGYELTGDRDHLGQARRWALSGVPFVYLWGRYPIMTYAAVPVYGATNFRAPLWIGLPVQWCGGVYAYALALLAEHDRMLDWQKLARGILIAGEQMQYPDGKLVGCLPDVFYLPSQRRAGPSINPCALASLRMVLDGELDAIAVAVNPPGRNRKHRIAAPFPVQLVEGDRKARIRAKKGVKYQVLIDGQRIVDVTSQGIDDVPLE